LFSGFLWSGCTVLLWIGVGSAWEFKVLRLALVGSVGCLVSIVGLVVVV